MILDILKLITIMMLIVGLNLHFKEEANRKHFKNIYREMKKEVRANCNSLYQKQVKNR